jgi:hypothetical protein
MTIQTVFSLRVIATVSLLTAATYVSLAAEERPDSERRASRREGLPADTERRPSPLGLFDTDRDGVISAAEVDAASAVLRRLDRDKDGKLSGEELIPRRPRGGGEGKEGGGGGGGRPPRDE